MIQQKKSKVACKLQTRFITFLCQNPPQNLILIFIIRIYAKKQFHIERGIASQTMLSLVNRIYIRKLLKEYIGAN